MQILENCGWHIALKCTPDGLKWNQSLENQCGVWEGRPSASASPPPPHLQRPAVCSHQKPTQRPQNLSSRCDHIAKL